MAEQSLGSTNKAGSGSAHGFEKAAGTAKGVADQALSVGRDLKGKTKDMAGSSTEAIKDHAAEFVDAAKDVASQATDKLKQAVDGQKTAGAEYVGSLADTMRRAAREFDGDLPIAGTYIRKAASHVEGVADTMKTGNFTDLVRGAQSFARRQPTAFLGIAVLAGFGVVRFLKSSAQDSGSGTARSRQGGGEKFGENGMNRSQASNASNRSYADNRGYRDDFTR
ncbi:YtxH domain-containing protein [Bradyrhizobium sp.]|uniref:YtxH domain-containing protein n=1 Tax=Bradyrhizobium sp. TaxID=376 RepID=UPI000B2296D4|nr:YtxH domain-containing protein [Bradyrhizobium sp.]